MTRLDLGDVNPKESSSTTAISGLTKTATKRDVDARLSAYGLFLQLSTDSAKMN